MMDKFAKGFVLVVEDGRSCLAYREADGTSKEDSGLSLVNKPEPTPEEREWVARFMEAGGYTDTAKQLRKGKDNKLWFSLSSALPVLRERK